VRFFMSCLLLCFSSILFATDTYKFDPTHTYVLWHTSHFGYSLLSGKFIADGTLIGDPKNPQTAKLNVVIHTIPSYTGIPELDDILYGSNFFNTAKYTAATFVSNKVTVTGKDTANVSGTLTIRGIAKQAVLKVKLNQMGIHPYFHKKAVGFSATTSVKRSDFGMTGYIPGVGDDIQIEIQAEAEITP
jgi:polyisoprenoid-binding protein YceI